MKTQHVSSFHFKFRKERSVEGCSWGIGFKLAQAVDGVRSMEFAPGHIFSLVFSPVLCSSKKKYISNRNFIFAPRIKFFVTEVCFF